MRTCSISTSVSPTAGESDYASTGWAVNTLTDFNQKNTTLRVGIGGNYDRVEVFFAPEYLPKHNTEGIIGVTQLLDPHTFVTLNFTWGRATGYLAEPHKFVEKAIRGLHQHLPRGVLRREHSRYAR